MSFEKLELDKLILKAIKNTGYEAPTEIQSSAIPVIHSGKDLLASAQTGTGKTAAFILPALNLVTNARSQTNKKSRDPRVLVLTPTREPVSYTHLTLPTTPYV